MVSIRMACSSPSPSPPLAALPLIDLLPAELVACVAGAMRPRDLAAFARTCVRVRKLCRPVLLAARKQSGDVHAHGAVAYGTPEEARAASAVDVALAIASAVGACGRALFLRQGHYALRTAIQVMSGTEASIQWVRCSPVLHANVTRVPAFQVEQGASLRMAPVHADDTGSNLHILGPELGTCFYVKADAILASRHLVVVGFCACCDGHIDKGACFFGIENRVLWCAGPRSCPRGSDSACRCASLPWWHVHIVC